MYFNRVSIFKHTDAVGPGVCLKKKEERKRENCQIDGKYLANVLKVPHFSPFSYLYFSCFALENQPLEIILPKIETVDFCTVISHLQNTSSLKRMIWVRVWKDTKPRSQRAKLNVMHVSCFFRVSMWIHSGNIDILSSLQYGTFNSMKQDQFAAAVWSNSLLDF